MGTVKSVWDMLKADFIFHCREKHARMRYITRNEHDQDHRLHAKEIEHSDKAHIHEEP